MSLWSIIRARWKEILLLALAVLILSVFALFNEVAIGTWLLVTLVIGVLCGTGVFAGDKFDKSRFISEDTRPSSGRLWRIKTGFWLLTAAGTAVIIFMRMRIGNLPSNARFSSSPTLIGLFRRLPSGLLLSLWLIIGFSVGQFFAMFWRKNGMAIVVSLFVSVAVAGLWVPSLAVGGLHAWQVFALPASCSRLRDSTCPLGWPRRLVPVAPSSRGLGHGPFKAATRVRIPSGSSIHLVDVAGFRTN